MLKNVTLFLAACLCLCSTLAAQNRYIDPLFEVGDPTVNVVYSNNIDLIALSQGATGPVPQTMDVYEPVGDTVALRPVVVTFHTGNFLPQYFNGGPYGSTTDSANVEIISRLVQRGYVGISATYRKGWQPTATADSIRTGSLLQAVYRASQDAHALARFLRKSVAEDGNPYRIDTSRITYWGLGSGGYVVLAHNFLDRVDEILQNPNFYTPSGIPLVNEAINSNPQGLLPTMQNVVNHPGYNSNVAFTVNLAGALGDTLWMDGMSEEAPTISMHSLTDPFAPFYAGTVIVPTSPPMPVVDVQGSNLVTMIANDKGLNDVLVPANSVALESKFGSLSRILNQFSAAYKTVTTTSPIPTSTLDEFQLGRDNLWPVLRTVPPNVGGSGATTGVWNWFDEAALRATIAAINVNVPTANLNANNIIAGEDQTNPHRDDPAAAKANIDTLIAYFIPRAYYALDLDGLVSSRNDLVQNSAVGLEVFPNPANEGFTVKTATGHPIRSINVIDLSGRIVATFNNLNQSTFRIERGNLPRGTYILQLRLDEGVTAKKVMLN
ncbi:T9SS type A sorting domain-containing protein [Neolewinella lacunae]|uniref:T9SS type A sorting domain-containing protein n=1 Tax=Neolewinella lacunae TaxID=1517758 RepID=A0A923PK60_9BACT|nr:T9SS type A sorting domain-containing protein [Neolewinella lacunae]MBC6995582.1 T9SS type A sorting domain-containing protein [Neolewinella lacunae]MDN3635618.1 T9SS type A sorting domain-containing protein [Neolewinella lacunae]